MNFKSAGCLFTNDNYVLAGYQARKQKPFLSGLGGKRQGEETSFVTALREAIEELFELQTVSLEWIEEIYQSIPPLTVFQNGEYVILHYSFQNLEDMLYILSNKNISSPLYTVFPLTLQQLLFDRKKIHPPAEISHLALLPLLDHSFDTPLVSSHFLKDLRILLEKNSSN